MRKFIGAGSAILILVCLSAFRPDGWTQDELRQQAMLQAAAQQQEQFQVKHHVKGNNVYVESFIPNFHFVNRGSTASKQGEGYIHLFLNGQKVDDIYTAAFIVRGLPVGKHEIKLVLAKNEQETYGIEQTFEVTI